MKVIGVSNYDNEFVSDVLIKSDLTELEAKELATTMNNRSGDSATYFYKAVEDDKKLYKFEP